MDERTAIQRLKCGDINGLEWLVARFHNEAIQVAFLITGDSQMAEDVAQDVFLNIYHSIDSIDQNRPFRPYLMRSISNLAIQHSNNHNQHISLDSEYGDKALEEFLATEADPIEENLITSEFKQRVRDAIQKLSPRQRAVVVQRYFLDMSEKEMTEELGIAPGTVKWLLNRARNALRAILGAERGSL